MQVQSYLMFEGRCEEALAFYGQALDAQTRMLLRYKDSPEPPMGERAGGVPGDKIMHAELRIGDTSLMASDGLAGGKPVLQGIALALSVATEAEARRRFDALADGGTVLAPLTKTFFSPAFGMVNDRFGVAWMVIAGAG